MTKNAAKKADKSANKKPAAKKKPAATANPAMRTVLAAVREDVADEGSSLFQAAQLYLGEKETEALRGDLAASVESDRYDDVSVVIANVRQDGVEAYVAKLQAAAPSVKTHVLSTEERGGDAATSVAEPEDEANQIGLLVDAARGEG